MGKLFGKDEPAGLKGTRRGGLLNQPEAESLSRNGGGHGEESAEWNLRRNKPAAPEPATRFAPSESEVFARPPAREFSPGEATLPAAETSAPDEAAQPLSRLAWVRKRGHAITTVLLFFFTLLVYTRPADWWDKDWIFYTWMETLTFNVGVIMLALFLPLQLITDGSPTARPREFWYILVLLAMGLLSIPLADQDRWTARETFREMFLRAALVFIIIFNAIRTERRWRFLVAVNWCVGVFLAYKAFESYLSGVTTVEGYRVGGILEGMFGNPNDLSQHLVTMTPLTVAFFLAAPRSLSDLRQGSSPPQLGLIGPLILVIPRLARRIFYAVCGFILLLGTMVTFSRSGFLATMASALTLTWKLGRKRRTLLMSLVMVFALGFLAAAPGEYRNRIFSILDSDLEATGGKGSADARKGLLGESVKVALRHPVLGIGMGNFRLIYDYQTHNSYTQVAAEMGLLGLMAYLFFIVAPLKRLREIEKATCETPDHQRFYYLSVGLQASLVAYMVGSFFGSIAYYYHIYYLVGFAVSFRLIYYNARGISVNALRLPEAEEKPATSSLRPVPARA
jgi:O-antigen ligase